MPIPEFITHLRSSIGHDLLWLPGVSAVVIDAEGRVLLGRRADNGRWAVPSGILEPGEQPAVGLAREVLEETGIEVEVVALTSTVSGDVVHYGNDDRAQYLDLCFWCRPVTGEARVADDESLEVGWFRTDALPAGLMTSSVERIGHAMAFVADHDAGRLPQPYFVRS